MHLAVTVDTLLVVDVLSLQPLQVAGQVSRQGCVRVDFVFYDRLCDVLGVQDLVRHSLGGYLILASPGSGTGMTNSARFWIEASLIGDPGARGLGFLRTPTPPRRPGRAPPPLFPLSFWS